MPVEAAMRPVTVGGWRIRARVVQSSTHETSTHVRVVPRGATGAVRQFGSSAVAGAGGIPMFVTTRDPLYVQAMRRWFCYEHECWGDEGSSPGSSILPDSEDIWGEDCLADLGVDDDYDDYAYGLDYVCDEI